MCRGLVSRREEVSGGADMVLVGIIWPDKADGEVGWLEDEEEVDVDEFFLCAFGRTMTSWD